MPQCYAYITRLDLACARVEKQFLVSRFVQSKQSQVLKCFCFAAQLLSIIVSRTLARLYAHSKLWCAQLEMHHVRRSHFTCCTAVPCGIFVNMFKLDVHLAISSGTVSRFLFHSLPFKVSSSSLCVLAILRWPASGFSGELFNLFCAGD